MIQYAFIVRFAIVTVCLVCTSCNWFDSESRDEILFPDMLSVHDSYGFKPEDYKLTVDDVSLTENASLDYSYEQINSDLKYKIIPPDNYMIERQRLKKGGNNDNLSIIEVYKNNHLVNNIYINSIDNKFYQSIANDSDTKGVGDLYLLPEPIYQVVPPQNPVGDSKIWQEVELIIPARINKESGVYAGFNMYSYQGGLWRKQDYYVTNIICPVGQGYPIIVWWYSADTKRIFIMDDRDLVIIDNNSDVVFTKEGVLKKGSVVNFIVNEETRIISLVGLKFKKKWLCGFDFEYFNTLVRYED